MAMGGTGGGGSARGVRAGGAYVELGVRDRITQSLRAIRAKFLAFGKLVATGGAAGAAAGGGLLAAAIPTLGDLAKLDATAKAFGLTAEKATGLFGVMEASGSDVRDATEGLVTLGQRVNDAVSGTGEDAKKLFDGLGVSAEKFVGLDPAEQFYQMHAALRQVQDPALRVQLLLKAVGEDTGKNLINTLSLTNEELRAQADGFAMSGDQLAAASKASAAYAKASATIGMVWKQVAVTVAPLIETLANKVSGFLAPLKNLSGWWELQAARFELGWANLVLNLTGVWNQFKDFFVDGWHDAVFVIENIWNDFTAWGGKVFIDMLAEVRKGFGETVGDMLRLAGKIPGMGPVFNAAAFGVDAVGLAGADKLKAGVERARQQAENELNKAKQKADEARQNARAADLEEARNAVVRAEKRVLEARLALEVVKKEEGVAAKQQQMVAAVSSTRGLFGGLAGAYLAAGLGGQNTPAAQQVKELRGVNKRLENLIDIVVRKDGNVFA